MIYVQARKGDEICSEEKIKKDDLEYYARVNYYIGNLGRKMLDEIPDDNALYFQIGQTALVHDKLNN